jgi:starch synthase
MENLRDFDAATGTGNALMYQTDSGPALWDTISRAQALFKQKETWAQLVENALKTQFSWEKSATQLSGLYRMLESARAVR